MSSAIVRSPAATCQWPEIFSIRVTHPPGQEFPHHHRPDAGARNVDDLDNGVPSITDKSL